MTTTPVINPNLIDLFSGAGGMTLGFTRAGFRPILAVEADGAAAETYQRNFGAHVHAASIESLRKFPSANVIIGGPPCQGFSPLGRNRTSETRTELNALWRQYMRAVKQVQPEVFVIENVPEFLRSVQYQSLLDMMASDRRLRRYQVDAQVLDATDYGVPQKRRRALVIGTRVGQPSWPRKTHGAPTSKPFVTVRDAIGDLPLNPTDIDLHLGRTPTAKSLERYEAVPEGGNRFDLRDNRPDLLPPCWARKETGTTDVFGRLWWDRPASTIRTEFYKPEKGRYLHPSAHRPITHREAARLQTFPDRFAFAGSRIEIARQIGNAVPPRLAEVLARHIRREFFAGR
jgi:DNA (cytosine-5)-methyltransferase 1